MPTINGKRIDEFTPMHARRARISASIELSRDLSQTQFGQLLSHSRTAVARWENGTRNPTPGMKFILMKLVEEPEFIKVVAGFTGETNAETLRDNVTDGSAS